MQNARKIFTRKTLVIAAIIIIILFVVIIAQSGKAKPSYEYAPFALPEEFELPDSRLILLGTATHGNIEPFEAAEQIVRKMHEEYGSVAFILEEDVGAGVFIDKNHSMYDSEKSSSYMPKSKITSGYGDLIYATKEMAELLQTLKELDIRVYGVDIQSTSWAFRVLYDYMQDLEFQRIEDIKQAQYNKYSSQENRKLLADLDVYLLQLFDDGEITERNYDFISHLADTIKTNLTYREDGSQFSERDRMMAENTLWVMEHESKHYSNEHFLLLAHNAHVVKEPILAAKGTSSEVECVTMGHNLTKSLGEDSYVIVTEAQYNSFYSNGVFRKKVFSIENKGNLFAQLEEKNADILFLTSERLIEAGVLEWDMSAIGFKFSKLAFNYDPGGYISQIDTADAFDAMLLFRQMTPSHLDE